jgi:RimJ/RimL family protein N-acetyltransferase
MSEQSAENHSMGGTDLRTGNTGRIELRQLSGESREMADLQRVLEQAPRYAQLVKGSPPGRTEAQSTFTMLPDGKTYGDKFVFGAYFSSQMIGCIDVIRGYPRPNTATIGLLLIAEGFQRKGIGSEAYRSLEAVIRSWGTCTTARIGVIATNSQVLPFWESLGFVPTGERKTYEYGSIHSEIIILSKDLAF